MVNRRKSRNATLGELDLELIRHELHEIAKIIGPDEPCVDCSDNVSWVDISFRDIANLYPEVFDGGASWNPRFDTTLSIAIPDLCEQFAKGKVLTTIRNLVMDVPPSYLSLYAMQHKEDKVMIPLPMIVNALHPGELMRRIMTDEDRARAGQYGRPLQLLLAEDSAGAMAVDLASADDAELVQVVSADDEDPVNLRMVDDPGGANSIEEPTIRVADGDEEAPWYTGGSSDQNQ